MSLNLKVTVRILEIEKVEEFSEYEYVFEMILIFELIVKKIKLYEV